MPAMPHIIARFFQAAGQGFGAVYCLGATGRFSTEQYSLHLASPWQAPSLYMTNRIEAQADNVHKTCPGGDLNNVTPHQACPF